MGSVQPCLSSCPRAAWALHGRVAGSDIQWRAHRSLCLAKAALALLGEGICGFRGVMYPARLPQHSPSPALRGAPGLWARMAPWGAGSPCPQAAVSRERAGKREACDGWWEHREREAQGVCSKGKARCPPQPSPMMGETAASGDGCVCVPSPQSRVTPLPPPSPWWQGAPGHTPVSAAAPMGAAASSLHGLVGMDDGWTR